MALVSTRFLWIVSLNFLFPSDWELPWNDEGECSCSQNQRWRWDQHINIGWSSPRRLHFVWGLLFHWQCVARGWSKWWNWCCDYFFISYLKTTSRGSKKTLLSRAEKKTNFLEVVKLLSDEKKSKNEIAFYENICGWRRLCPKSFTSNYFLNLSNIHACFFLFFQAFHFYLLAQRQLYEGRSDAALRTVR